MTTSTGGVVKDCPSDTCPDIFEKLVILKTDESGGSYIFYNLFLNFTVFLQFSACL